MAIWNPWRGCHKYSEGCRFCYIHKGDQRRGVDTSAVIKTDKFYYPIEKNKNGEYKIKSGSKVFLCFSSDFLIEDADDYRAECWDMIKCRSDLEFIFLTKRIERFMEVIPEDWKEGYKNVTVGCTVENESNAKKRLEIFKKLPIVHKNIICQPLLEKIDLKEYLTGIELVVVGGESDKMARPLDYDWVLNIREQCIASGVHFEFRQCGSHFIKDGKMYNIPVKMLCSQAKKAGINT